MPKENMEELARAILNCDEEPLNQALRQQPTIVFERTNWNNTLLHEACLSKNPHAVRTLLEHWSDPNARGQFGRTPLQMAVKDGQQESVAIVKVLIEYGADPRVRDLNGWLPADEADLEIDPSLAEIRFLLNEPVGRKHYKQLDARAVHAAVAALLGLHPGELDSSTPLIEIRRRLVARYLDVFAFAQTSARVEEAAGKPVPLAPRFPPRFFRFEGELESVESWCTRVAKAAGLAADAGD